MNRIAVLMTCHNRRIQTLDCLNSLRNAWIPEDFKLEVFLVDDGSTDGTTEAVKKAYPKINIIKGDGNLFWAGGMRLAWEKASKKTYDAILLLNDDVKLEIGFLRSLLEANSYTLKHFGRTGIYCGATKDEKSGKLTYGAHKIKHNHLILRFDRMKPNGSFQNCDMANANILWLSKSVYTEIGFFDKKFTHGIADYEYTIRASRSGIPVILASEMCGNCVNDHGVNWKTSSVKLKNRIKYLKSPKGLAYKEYLYFIRKHFPLYLPVAFTLLWLKTFFPIFWERLKAR